jgi:hypothetical protein
MTACPIPRSGLAFTGLLGRTYQNRLKMNCKIVARGKPYRLRSSLVAANGSKPFGRRREDVQVPLAGLRCSHGRRAPIAHPLAIHRRISRLMKHLASGRISPWSQSKCKNIRSRTYCPGATIRGPSERFRRTSKQRGLYSTPAQGGARVSRPLEQVPRRLWHRLHLGIRSLRRVAHCSR